MNQMNRVILALLVVLGCVCLPGNAAWNELQTTTGCRVYVWDLGWMNPRVEWSGQCVKGEPISGTGTLTFVTGAFWWAQRGKFANGIPVGAIQYRTEQFPDSDVIQQFEDGCLVGASDGCTPRPTEQGASTANVKLIRKWGNDCVKLVDTKVERKEAGSDSEWVTTTFSLRNDCATTQHYEFMVGEKGFGRPKRPVLLNSTGLRPMWPEGKPLPRLAFSPLVQLGSSQALNAGQVATAQVDQLADKGGLPAFGLHYIIASCPTYGPKGPQAVFRDTDLERGWVCVPISG